MEFQFTRTMDQALIAFVISEASTLETAERRPLGRTAIQKIVYFLKIAGVQTDYSFRMHHYGPFCRDILDDLEYLQADDVINDRSSNPERSSDFMPSPSWEKFYGTHRGDLEPYQNTIKVIVSYLAPMEVSQLEVVSTLDFLFRKLRATGHQSDFKTPVIDDFIQVKNERYPRAELEKTYEWMAETHLVLP